ncbi:MAG TPA: FtsX-like permease family protein, partial [archaeon]|nr:FtsX-like permease family protein [archaeon]
VLKGTISSGGRGSALRKVLVVGQFAVSIILIICTIFVGRQLSYMQNKNLGFNKDQVISVSLINASGRKFIEPLKNEWLQNPSVTGGTASRFRLGNALGLEAVFFEGHNPDELATAAMMAVDYDYISFYGLELVAGRDFSQEFVTDYNPDNSGAYIINEALQEKLGWDSALGKKFGTNPDNLGTVIGVMKDFHFNSLHHKIEPLFFCIRPDRLSTLSVKIKPENMDATLGSLRKTWAAHVPNQLFEYSFLDEDFARLYKNEKLVARIIAAFSLLAVFVSCLGLFGLISFSAEQRTKEIGIRKVLGASVSNIVLLLSREFLILLGIAIVIACPVAWYFMDRWLQNFAYRIELGPETFILGGIIALAITVLTVSFQAVKAATANPVEALRYE